MHGEKRYQNKTQLRYNFGSVYIGSVLFRVSAFSGSKLASGVPAVIGLCRVEFHSFELTLDAGPPLAR